MYLEDLKAKSPKTWCFGAFSFLQSDFVPRSGIEPCFNRERVVSQPLDERTDWLHLFAALWKRKRFDSKSVIEKRVEGGSTEKLCYQNVDVVWQIWRGRRLATVGIDSKVSLGEFLKFFNFIKKF